MDLLPSNAAHWHLVLNHLPVVGSYAALLLLAWAWIKNTDDLKRVALASLVLVALTAIPAFLTGEPSERHLKGMQGISSRWMSSHEEIAEFTLWITIGAGVLALAAMIVFRKLHSLQRWVVGVFLLLGLAVCGFMVRTANYGGKIHHPEIRTYSTPETSSGAVE
jgi:uncharacterized membrane protein